MSSRTNLNGNAHAEGFDSLRRFLDIVENFIFMILATIPVSAVTWGNERSAALGGKGSTRMQEVHYPLHGRAICASVYPGTHLRVVYSRIVIRVRLRLRKACIPHGISSHRSCTSYAEN